MDSNNIANIIANIDKEALVRQILFSQSVPGYCLISEESMIIWVNSSLCSMFGYSKSELEGQQITIILSEDILKQQGLPEKIKTNNTIKDLSIRTKHKSGRFFFSTLSIDKIEQSGKAYYLYSFPSGSKRASQIITIMKKTFSAFIKDKLFFLVETEINHPYIIKTITRECIDILNRDFSEMQSKPLSLFLTNESRLAINDILESFVSSQEPSYIAELVWKKENNGTTSVATRTIIQLDKENQSFLMLVILRKKEVNSSASDEDTIKQDSTMTIQPDISPLVIQNKMIEYLERQVDEMQDEVSGIAKEFTGLKKDIEWIIKTEHSLDRDTPNPNQDIKNNIISWAWIHRSVVIPVSIIGLIVCTGVISVRYPHNPYIKKIESLIIELMGKN